MKEGLLKTFKLLAFILLIPVVIGVADGFYRFLVQMEAGFLDSFATGLLAFVLVYFFVCPPQVVFQFGQNITNGIFQFNPAVARGAQLILSFYSLLLFVLIALGTKVFVWNTWIVSLLTGALGFSFGLHLVMVARDLYDVDMASLKPHYFFVMSLVVVLNLLIFGFFLSLVSPTFNFSGFIEKAYQTASQIYTPIIRQLFLLRK